MMFRSLRGTNISPYGNDYASQLKWRDAVTKHDIKEINAITTHDPVWINQKFFVDYDRRVSKTALQYWMEKREEQQRCQNYNEGTVDSSYKYVYEAREIDSILLILLSKNPDLCNPVNILDEVLKMHDNSNLLTTVLKIAACRPIEEQKAILRNNFANIIEFTQTHYPQCLQMLMDLPDLQADEKTRNSAQNCIRNTNLSTSQSSESKTEASTDLHHAAAQSISDTETNEPSKNPSSELLANSVFGKEVLYESIGNESARKRNNSFNN